MRGLVSQQRDRQDKAEERNGNEEWQEPHQLMNTRSHFTKIWSLETTETEKKSDRSRRSAASFASNFGTLGTGYAIWSWHLHPVIQPKTQHTSSTYIVRLGSKISRSHSSSLANTADCSGRLQHPLYKEMHDLTDHANHAIAILNGIALLLLNSFNLTNMEECFSSTPEHIFFIVMSQNRLSVVGPSKRASK